MSDAYRAAGVDIDAGNETVERIKSHVKRTMRPEVIGSLGGFGGLFSLPSYRNPVLVSSTDGVGTKLKIAFAMDKHDTIGIDCVAMCVNDVVVQGAEPLFFLDYLATGRLNPAQAEAIVKGIADGCQEAGCSLIGGETAEMPGMYGAGEYDVAGFCVGAVERDRLLTGENIVPGDVLIGLASSGIHSNGFSLVRKVLLEENPDRLYDTVPWGGATVGEVLLTPTKIYVQPFLELMKRFEVKAGAHITGGGLIENIPRVLPKGCRAEIDRSTWEVPPVLKWIVREGRLSETDAYRTFNMGIGMVVILPADQAEEALSVLQEMGETAHLIGRIAEGAGGIRWIGGGKA